MPITKEDIKLFASARMTDELGGGGAMSGNALQDGLENNVFPDISTLDRAQGALQFRKVYPVALNTDTDPLLGVHVIFDDLADDPTVAAVLMPSAGQAEDVAALTAAMNAAGEAFPFRGAAYTTAIVPNNSATVPVTAVRAVLIPKTVLSEAVAGTLLDSGALPTTEAWIDSGQTITLTIAEIAGSLYLSVLNAANIRVLAASVTGTFTHPTQGAGTVAATPGQDGQITFTAGTYVRHFSVQADGASFRSSGAGDGLTSVAVTSVAYVRTALPKETLRFPAVDGQVSYTLAVPPGTAVQSELLQWAGGYATPNLGSKAMVVRSGAGLNFAELDRATGVLTLLFGAPLETATEIVFTYASAAAASGLLPAALVSGGLFTGSTAAVTPGAGLELAAAAFSIGGGEASLRLVAGIVTNSTNVVRGSATGAGVLTVPGNSGRSISGWFGVQINPSFGVSRMDATLPANITATSLVIAGVTVAGAAFTATANSAGVFSTAHVTGTYIAATGALSLVFAAPTKQRSMEFSGMQAQPQSVFASLWGLNPSNFASDGTVPVIRPGNVAVLRHTTVLAAATYANSNTIDAGRVNLADVRFVDANNRSIPNGWSVNLATGVTTVNDITGWVQPVKFQHSIEHVAMVLSVPNSGAAVLSRAVTRDFPAGSLLSTALLMGEFQARAGLAFAQETWTGVWSDTRIGDSIGPQYQQAAHPIVVTNEGAITERWAIHFDTGTLIRLVGETVGQIATGDVNSPLAPINPATGAPYFTLSHLGWGGGWSAGNVLRLPTTGANGPAWAARSVIPSAPSDTPDSVTLSTRGDRNA